MAEIARVYHGSRCGLQGAIRPVSDSSADFGSGFFDTLDCDMAIRRLKGDAA